jgi:hypothetical protein
VLEEQVLRHDGLLVSWAAPIVALHLMSGAGQSFSTSEFVGSTVGLPDATIEGSPRTFSHPKEAATVLYAEVSAWSARFPATG